MKTPRRPIAYAITATDNATPVVRIYDDIGPEWTGGVSANSFAKDLASLGQVESLNVRINSEGGDVFDANAIYNELVRHPATVTVDIDGMALSAASVIAMAGNRIRMAENAVLMIHNPWTIHAGDAASFRGTADILDKVKTTLVTAYRKQSGKSDGEVARLMDAESWYTADEAKAAGFVHEVVGHFAVAAAFDRSRFHAIPEWVKGRFDEQVIATPKLNESRLRLLKAEFELRYEILNCRVDTAV